MEQEKEQVEQNSVTIVVNYRGWEDLLLTGM
jgi:hypothetical protein